MLVSLASGVFMVVSVILYPLRRNWLLRRLGPCEYSFRGKFRFQFIGVLVASPFLVICASIRNFELPVLMIVSIVAVVLFSLSYRDLLHAGLGGLYEKGVVWNGRSILYTDIERSDLRDPFSFVVTLTRDRGTMLISGPKDFIDIVSAHIEKASSPLQ
jgi:hypothetical protein